METVKMCDLNKKIAATVFEMLNKGKVHLKPKDMFGQMLIVSDIEPKNLIYPEGWYYAKGNFRNKHTSSTGLYEEIPVVKSNGDSWREIAR